MRRWCRRVRRGACEQAKGVVIAYDRRFASEHFAAGRGGVLLARDIPVAVRGARGAYADVRSRSWSGGSPPASSSPQPQIRGRTTAQGEVAEGSAAGPDILKVLEARIAQNGGTAIPPATFRGRRSGRSRGALRPIRRLRGLRPSHRRLDALKAADLHILVSRCGAPARAGSRGFWPAARSASRRSPGANPVLRRREPGADPAQHR